MSNSEIKRERERERLGHGSPAKCRRKCLKWVYLRSTMSGEVFIHRQLGRVEIRFLAEQQVPVHVHIH